LEGDYTDTFEVNPSIVERAATFSVAVKSSRRLDYEKVKTITMTVMRGVINGD